MSLEEAIGYEIHAPALVQLTQQEPFQPMSSGASTSRVLAAEVPGDARACGCPASPRGAAGVEALAVIANANLDQFAPALTQPGVIAPM